MRLRSIWPSLLLLLVIVVVSLPLFQPDFFFVHDFVHAARIGEMWRGLSAGHWPVRWSSYFGFGYGMPLFQFYAPLPYAVGAIGYGLGLNVITAVKGIFLLASVIAVSGAYLAAKRLGNQVTGVIAATLFGLAPYRAVNLYVRGAVSEAWAMAFFPWITLGIVLILQRWRWGWLVLTGSLVGLLLSHNLSSLMFIPLSGFVALAGIGITRQGRSLAVWRELAVAYGGSVALSAFYIGPAFLEKNLTQLQLILSGYFDFRLHFVYIRQLITPYWGYGGSGWGVDDGLSFFLGWALLVGGALAAISLCVITWRKRQELWRCQALWWMLVSLVCAVIALAMTLGRSQFAWENVPLLSYIQFPWRWLAAASWWLALGIALSLNQFGSKIRMVLVLTVCSLAIFTQATYFKPESMVKPASTLYYTDPVRISTHMSEILMDYIPAGFDIAWAKQTPLPPGQLIVEPAMLQATPVEQDLPHYRKLTLDLNETTPVVLGIARFPEWQVTVNDVVVPITTSPHGLISVSLPAGQSVVELRWLPSSIRQVSDSVSIVAWVGLIGFLIWRLYQDRLVSNLINDRMSRF